MGVAGTLINLCRVCHTELEELVNWDNYPLTSVVATRDKVMVPVGKLTLGMCLKCGLIQLMDPDPASITYAGEYLSSNFKVASGIDTKQAEFLEYLYKLKAKPGAKVMEIGCYDGDLMTQMAAIHGFDVYGCDPSGPAVEAAKITDRIIPALFNPNSYIGHKFDVVVFRNVLEHAPDPLLFLMQVSRVLTTMGEIALEVPDGEFRVCNGIIGSIVPQHTSYFGTDTLRDILQRSGFGAIHCESKKGRILARATLRDKQKAVNSFAKEVYMCAVAGTRWNMLKALDIKKKLARVDGPLWLYGANTCSKELLVSGAFPEERIAGALDDDALKWGRVMVNTGIEIYPREKVKEITGTVVICSYYSHTDLYKYLTHTLPKGSRVLRLYPDIVLRKVV